MRRREFNASVRSVEWIASQVHTSATPCREKIDGALALLPRTEDRIGPRFRLSSVDRRHQSSVGMGVPSSAPSCLPQRHPSGAYEEGLAGMLTIIKASLLASALMLLESCTGYLTSYQTPCVEGHVCECVRYTTVNRSWLDCRDYGRVKSRAY
jgi:hypothetical protein